MCPNGASIARAYDHIIVGGGSAGSVLAARLSECDSCRVLMIEAGGADFDRPAMVEPGLWRANWGSDADWRYQTVPQTNLDGRIIDWTRGKVIGGSSTINAMAWVWGHPADFDGWARKGNVGWDFDSLKPVFMRMESCTRTGRKIARGTAGPMALFSCPATDPLIAAFLSSCRELGHAVLDDVNGPVEEGAGTGDLNIKDGRRFSVVHAYLLPVLGRSNLTLLTKGVVESLIFEGTRCIGVRCRSAGALREIRSDHDVILCAGSIETPRLLMISGIGNADQLAKLGIAVVADLPGVGENLHDHCQLRTFAAEAGQAALSPHLEAHLFVRSRETLPIPDLDIALTRATQTVPAPATSRGFTLLAGLFQPRSRGRITLTSAEIRAAPHIDPNYLSEPADMDALCIAAERSRELGLSRLLSRWHHGKPETPPQDKAALRTFIRRAVGTYRHPVGTCAMGIGARAVVDPMLRVRGISNLRIADNSVMPSITTGHTLAPTLVIAERAADMIVAASH
ncbi:MAG TPA: GMC family oxidoreductase N-terminal domain-containing protein [Acetobacteraceae bacterium]|nr:GMC family oxidoreductase N-terminal domain-containing protein [Acetobacteraceae bacterium]